MLTFCNSVRKLGHRRQGLPRSSACLHAENHGQYWWESKWRSTNHRQVKLRRLQPCGWQWGKEKVPPSLRRSGFYLLRSTYRGFIHQALHVVSLSSVPYQRQALSDEDLCLLLPRLIHRSFVYCRIEYKFLQWHKQSTITNMKTVRIRNMDTTHKVNLCKWKEQPNTTKIKNLLSEETMICNK